MIIPAGRKTDFSNPGFIIPTTGRSVHATLSPVGGGGDDFPQIKAALAAAAADAGPGDIQEVVLSAGSYHLITAADDDVLNLLSYVVLRGDTTNPRDTKIYLDVGTRFGMRIGTWRMGFANWTAPVSGYTQGSNQLVFVDAAAIAAFSAGDFIMLTQRDTGNDDVTSGGFGPIIRLATVPNLPFDDNASVGQMLKITNKTGATLTVEGIIHYDFLAECEVHIAHAKPFGGTGEYVQYAGFENFQLIRTVNSPFNTSFLIAFNECAYCWLKNCELDKGVGRMVSTSMIYRCVFQSNYIHHSWIYTSGGLGYGFSLGFYSSDCLIEDNIIWYFNAPMTFETAGPGNVIRYNFADGAWLNEGTGQTLLACFAGHQSCSFETLLEGNQGGKLDLDIFHGNAFRFTVFRNDLIGVNKYWPADHPYNDVTLRVAVVIRTDNHTVNLVGNVLFADPAYPPDAYDSGGANDKLVYSIGGTNIYLHGNYDGFNDAVLWDATNADHAIPNSLSGLTAAPEWWTPGLAWPPIGSDLAPKVTDIPAKTRFLALNGESVCLVPPVVSGIARVGDLATLAPGVWSGLRFPRTYQWEKGTAALDPRPFRRKRRFPLRGSV